MERKQKLPALHPFRYISHLHIHCAQSLDSIRRQPSCDYPADHFANLQHQLFSLVNEAHACQVRVAYCQWLHHFFRQSTPCRYINYPIHNSTNMLHQLFRQSLNTNPLPLSICSPHLACPPLSLSLPLPTALLPVGVAILFRLADRPANFSPINAKQFRLANHWPKW